MNTFSFEHNLSLNNYLIVTVHRVAKASRANYQRSRANDRFLNQGTNMQTPLERYYQRS